MAGSHGQHQPRPSAHGGQVELPQEVIGIGGMVELAAGFGSALEVSQHDLLVGRSLAETLLQRGQRALGNTNSNVAVHENKVYFVGQRPGNNGRFIVEMCYSRELRSSELHPRQIINLN